MKVIQLLATAAFLLFATAVVAQNKTLPSVKVKTLDGATVNVQDYAKNGKITVISFWATWCSPCKRELDAIADVYEDWQDDYNVELIAVTIDDSRAVRKVRPMVESKGWEYEIITDTKEELKRAMNVQSIPHTFVVDQNGNIVYNHTGYSPGDEYDLEDKLKKLAGK